MTNINTMVLSNGKEFKLPFEIQIDEKDIKELNLGQDSKTHILAIVFNKTVNGLQKQIDELKGEINGLKSSINRGTE